MRTSVIDPLQPLHICGRSNNREAFPIPLETVWSIFEDYLYLLAKGFDTQIHSFVLMPNHFHLLLTQPDGNISKAMNYFMRETSRQINREAGRINRNWGARYHRSSVNSYNYYMMVYKYVYRNPVKAGLCTYVEEYPYSTLCGILGLKKLIIPVIEDKLLFTPNFDSDTLAWLNRASTQEDEVTLKAALKRKVFEPPKRDLTGYLNRLNDKSPWTY